ncbi:hypothetical protein HKX48_004427 [Thoreauomyces humboldtii]|nr:hypothetical protein HKX48_004427 [Thoreauomyces humboldtii]
MILGHTLRFSLRAPILRESPRYRSHGGLLRPFSSSLLVNETFVVIAHDADDRDALSRRMATRPAHIVRVKELKAKGQLVTGGAVLRDDHRGDMCGSVMILDMDGKEEVEEWVKTDPYVNAKVWVSWDILPFKAANV